MSRRTLAVALLAGLGGACGRSPAQPDAGPCFVASVDLSALQPDGREAHREALAHVAEASQGKIAFAERPGGISARVAPGEQGEGVAGARGDLRQGELIYSSDYWAQRRPVVEHEVLHLVGLADSSVEGELMCAGCESARDPNRGMSEGERREVARLSEGYCGSR